ncbi:MAG: VOC family protein [Pseudomonadota bacterium]
MQLGAFSISLSVKDITSSYDFYVKLGFEKAGGNIDENWLIMRNGDHVIGLFQGMFEGNLMTFNPGWDQQSNNLEEFTDVGTLQRELKDRGISIPDEMAEQEHGPKSFMISDPDGNQILFDQHR